MATFVSTLAALAAAFASTGASPIDSRSSQPAKRQGSSPTLATSTLLGIVSDPTWNRDSCTSIGVYGRELWTCRDSQSSTAFISSSASWTDFNSSALPDVTAGVLAMYGTNSDDAAYFPVQADECGGAAGTCSDGTRYAIWQDSRPMIAGAPPYGGASLYTWIRKSHITADLAALDLTPATSLYRSDYTSALASDELPPATLVNENWWPEGHIAYGSYGWVQDGEYSYLYGLLNNTDGSPFSAGVTVAKVLTSSVEDPSAYSFYTSTGYQPTAPDINDVSAAIPNAGTTGQGTFYYSSYFTSYVWIGISAMGCNADFLVATAPAPEGPWSEPTLFYSGEVGSSQCGAYSQQAHPELTNDDAQGNYIFLTYTKVDGDGSDGKYTTPLIQVNWV